METSRALREKWKDLDDVAVTTSISGNAEFNAAGVDKGVGLAMLRTKLGIDRMHVIMRMIWKCWRVQVSVLLWAIPNSM